MQSEELKQKKKKYDTVCKKVLSRKPVLAKILKSCVSEYKERLETTIPMTAKIERYDFSSAVDKYTTTTEKRTYTVPWLYVPKDKDYNKDNKKETTTDPFNAKDFYNPEDFYDYYYDDFMDYYEAEDYYYEHCG